MHKHEWAFLDRQKHWEIWECTVAYCSEHKMVYVD